MKCPFILVITNKNVGKNQILKKISKKIKQCSKKKQSSNPEAIRLLLLLRC